MTGRSRNIAVAVILSTALGATMAGEASAREFPVERQVMDRSAVNADLRATHAPFGDLPMVDGHAAGLVGDGRTDNTEAFLRLFSRPGQHVSIGPGDYRTGRFVVPGNTILTLAAGTVIRDTGKLGPSQPFIQIYGDHVRIEGNGAKVLENRADYTSGMGRHGIYMIKVSDILIEDLESSSTGGDGFYIGGPRGKPSTNISLIRVVARNNRRQGLSIVNARNIDIVDSTFADTAGTPPAFGIDLEPNYPTDVLQGIRLIRVRTSGNHGGGIAMYLNPLKPDSTPIDIEIVDHISSDEPMPLSTSTAEASVGGSVRYIVTR